MRFARERDILARLEHPNIARLYDAGVAQGQPFLAMERVHGRHITAYCDARRLDVEGRLGLFLQVLAAVQSAHTNLVLHRDLKPSNILVTDEGQVRLLDFGVATLLDPDGPGAGHAAHPRQRPRPHPRLREPRADPRRRRSPPPATCTRSAVVLFELLTGARPYELEGSRRRSSPRPSSPSQPAAPERRGERGGGRGAGHHLGEAPAAAGRATSTAILLRALAKQPDDPLPER